MFPIPGVTVHTKLVFLDVFGRKEFKFRRVGKWHSDSEALLAAEVPKLRPIGGIFYVILGDNFEILTNFVVILHSESNATISFHLWPTFTKLRDFFHLHCFYQSR